VRRAFSASSTDTAPWGAGAGSFTTCGSAPAPGTAAKNHMPIETIIMLHFRFIYDFLKKLLSMAAPDLRPMPFEGSPGESLALSFLV
jgi:hypothetical protein